MFRFNRFIFWFIVLSILCSYEIVFGLTWTSTNQATLAWSPVTTLGDGSAIPPGDLVSYEVFMVPEGGNKLTERVLMGETVDARFVVTFVDEGRYFLGVLAKRYKSETIFSYSTVSWSDNPVVVVEGKTFGIIYFQAPAGALGLEVENNAD